MTQAAVSYQIRQLEDRIGRSLFVREKGKVRLSEAGRRLLPALSGAFSSMADAFAAIRSEDEDVLSINASVSIGGSWLSARIGRFQLRYPDLAVRISLDNEVVDLPSSNFDVAIRLGDGNWPGLRSEFLFRHHYAPICTPEFLRRNRIERPEDLLSVERFAPNERRWAGWFAAAGVGQPEPLRGGVVFDNQLQDANALRDGSAIAMMTPLFCRAELEAGHFVQPFETIYYTHRSQWLVHSETRTGVRKIERLREWLLEELEAEKRFSPAQVWEPV